MTEKIKLKDMTPEQRTAFFKEIGSRGGKATHKVPYHFEKLDKEKLKEISRKGGKQKKGKK